MSGAPDLLYVQARRVLLDATDALADQLDAIVLVVAQAIYLRTGDADLAVAECTSASRPNLASRCETSPALFTGDCR